jgi:hypothetical protein
MPLDFSSRIQDKEEGRILGGQPCGAARKYGVIMRVANPSEMAGSLTVRLAGRRRGISVLNPVPGGDVLETAEKGARYAGVSPKEIALVGTSLS